MGYTGPSLAHLFDLDHEIAKLCREITDTTGDHMTASIKEFTPVGHRPHEAGYIPGHLRESIEQKLIVVAVTPLGITYETGSETNVEYAVYVEHGTGLWGPYRRMYEIRPKNPDGWLRWIDPHTGLPVFAKRVMHPGSPPNNMFAKGVAKTEQEFKIFAGSIVERWTAEMDVLWQARARERVLHS